MIVENVTTRYLLVENNQKLRTETYGKCNIFWKQQVVQQSKFYIRFFLNLGFYYIMIFGTTDEMKDKSKAVLISYLYNFYHCMEKKIPLK